MLASITSHPLTFDASSIMPYLGIVTPFLVAMLTRYNASDKLKSIIGLVVPALVVLIVRSVDSHGHAVIAWAALGQFVITYGVQVLTYLGFWKHFGINEKVLPSVGIGPSEPVAPPGPSVDALAIISAIESLLAPRGTTDPSAPIPVGPSSDLIVPGVH